MAKKDRVPGNKKSDAPASCPDNKEELVRVIEEQTAQIRHLSEELEHKQEELEIQNEEMEAQVEELRVNNQDLQESAQSLKESRERLDYALLVPGIGAWEMDLLNHTSWRTLPHDQIFGYKALLNQWSFEMFLLHVVPEDRDDAERKFARAREAHEDWDFECRISRLDGTVRWVHVQGRYQYDQKGTPVRMGGIVQDVTARRQAEDALRASEEKYRELVEDANSIIIRWDIDGRIRFFNEYAEKFFGYSQDEVLGRDVMLLVPATESTGRDLVAMVDDIKRHPEKYRGNVNENVRKNGERVWVSWTNRAVLDEPGNVVGILAVGNDITELRLADERSRQQNAILEGINRIFRETLTSDTEEELGEVCLRLAEEITGSKFGFIGEINENGMLDDLSISNPGWEACRMANPIGHRTVPTGFKVHGIYGRVLKDGKSLYTNDPPSHPDSIGTPPGHPPLTAFLGVPLMHRGKVIGMVAVGNREGGYRDEDLRALEGIAPSMVEALRRKRMEQAVRKSEERLALSMKAAQSGTFDWDTVKNVNVWSDELLALYGLKRPDFLGSFESWLECLIPEDREKGNVAIKRSLDTGLFEDEFRIRRRDTGEVRWMYGRGQVLYDKDGRPARLIGTNVDITDRKRAEEALKLDEARLEALVELNDMAGATEQELFDFALESAILITGSRIGIIDTVSPDESTAFIRSVTKDVMAGCEVAGQQTLDIHSGGIWTEIFRTRQPMMINDYAAVRPGKKIVPAGHMQLTRLLEVPVFEQDRIVAVCLVGNKGTDYNEADSRQLSLLMNGLWSIIARKRAESEILDARDQAELYLDLMGHDISNMHQIAMSQLELAREVLGTEGKLGREDEEMIDVPLATLQRSARLIENVRKLQKINAGEYELAATDLGKMLEEVVDIYSNFYEKDVAIAYEPAEGCLVNVNPLLKDVFMNLVDNAVKHSGPAPRIRIALERDVSKSICCVTVEDNGYGIPDEKKEEVFFRLKRGQTTVRGTGIGLYIVKTLVEGFGGSVRVEDRVPGDYRQGSRFIVCLPAANSGRPASDDLASSG